ncbi:MAG: F0F1 ATP synthase subunit alpha, partial [Sumerlaeia bacterium]
RPAINVGLSVSRVGGNAQTNIMKKVGGKLRLELAQYRELEAFSKFGSDLDRATQQMLTRGSRLVEILKQGQNKPEKLSSQVLQIFAGTNGYADKVPVTKTQAFCAGLLKFVEKEYADIIPTIDNGKKLTDELTTKMKAACQAYLDIFLAELND